MATGSLPLTARRLRSAIPPTGAVIGTVPKGGKGETRCAIEAAERALIDWRARTAKERHAILIRWFDLMMEKPGGSGAHHDGGGRQAPDGRRAVKSPMARASSSGSPRRASASMAT